MESVLRLLIESMTAKQPAPAWNLATLVPVIAALVAAFASVTGAWLSYKFSRAKSIDDAKTGYEFEARKRLYAECQPLLMQIADASGSVWGRISAMADRASEGRFDSARSSWLGKSYGPYYRDSMIYRIFRLLALVRLFKQKLTLFDATLDENIMDKMILGEILEDFFCRDFMLAKLSPELAYDPYGKTRRQGAGPGEYVYQGLVRGDLEGLADLLIKDVSTNSVMPWHEFEDAVAIKGSKIAERAAPMRELFLNFHPDLKPVLWRILVAHAFVCYLITVNLSRRLSTESIEGIAAEVAPKFDHRKSAERQGPNPAAAHLGAIVTMLKKELAEKRLQYGQPIS